MILSIECLLYAQERVGGSISCLLPVHSLVFWEINSALALIRLQRSEAEHHTI